MGPRAAPTRLFIDYELLALRTEPSNYTLKQLYLKLIERVDIFVFSINLHHHGHVGIAFLEVGENLSKLLVGRNLQIRKCGQGQV